MVRKKAEAWFEFTGYDAGWATRITKCITATDKKLLYLRT
jgi:hypothetical protein